MAPPHVGSEFYNYKGTHSLVLMAVVDYKYSFTLIDIGAAGHQSDGGIFVNSKISKKLKCSQLNVPRSRVVTEGRQALPYVFVGDEAFPLSPHLVRPYPGKVGLSVEQKVYNYRLSRACLTSENTFGILASRWRIFRKPIIAKLENVDNILKACMCLHNYAMQQEQSRTYFASNLIDHEMQDGTIIPGLWREESSIITPIHRVGADNFTLQMKNVRDT